MIPASELGRRNAAAQIDTTYYNDTVSNALNVTSPTFGQLNTTQNSPPRFFKLALVMKW